MEIVQKNVQKEQRERTVEFLLMLASGGIFIALEPIFLIWLACGGHLSDFAVALRLLAR